MITAIVALATGVPNKAASMRHNCGLAEELRRIYALRRTSHKLEVHVL